MSNVVERLASESIRVAVLRGRYESLRSMHSVNMEPAIFMMTQALIRAEIAAGSGDLQSQIESIRELGEFKK